MQIIPCIWSSRTVSSLAKYNCCSKVDEDILDTCQHMFITSVYYPVEYWFLSVIYIEYPRGNLHSSSYLWTTYNIIIMPNLLRWRKGYIAVIQLCYHSRNVPLLYLTFLSSAYCWSPAENYLFFFIISHFPSHFYPYSYSTFNFLVLCHRLFYLSRLQLFLSTFLSHLCL
jgi:hypothetical protein